MTWGKKLSFVLACVLLAACGICKVKTDQAKGGSATGTPAAAGSQTSANQPNTLSDLGLVLTQDGIEFANVECIGAFTSQVTDTVANEKKLRTAYKITSTCTSNGDVYTWAYSNIQYNSLGQQSGYNLKLHSSRTNEEHNAVCSNILRDSMWQIISYKAEINGKAHQFKR